jgi:SAM-dependent methyltransferase
MKKALSELGFSQEWEKIYQGKSHLTRWPWSDLVSMVHRNVANLEGKKVLELGCGAGPNIAFFQALKTNYFGVDGSPTIIAELKNKFPEMKNQLIACDFTRELPAGDGFDLVVDRASVTCNSTESIKKTIALVHQKLKTGGLFIGIDWFSTRHSSYRQSALIDEHTCSNLNDGHLKNTGLVHFSTKPHILELFKDFEISSLVHKEEVSSIPEDNFCVATWRFVARKK